MKVFYEKEPSKRIECAATIGVLDGVHPGHQFILRRVVAAARRQGIASLAITFDVPPQYFLRKQFPGCLSDLAQKKALIAQTGIDYVWVLKTSEALLNVRGEVFLQRLLQRVSIKEFIVGEDFRFGRHGGSGRADLRRFGLIHGFDVVVIKKRQRHGVRLSSSYVRQLIKKGFIHHVPKFLGYPYCIRGTVIHGREWGTQLGFATANCALGDYVMPARGVYAGLVRVGRKRFLAGVNVGTSPTLTSSQQLVFEAHLIGFDGTLRGKVLEVTLLDRLRGEKKFPSVELLKKAIAHDCADIVKKYRKIK